MNNIGQPPPVMALAVTVGGQVLPPWSTMPGRIPLMNDAALKVAENGGSGDVVVLRDLHGYTYYPPYLPGWTTVPACMLLTCLDLSSS